MIVYDARLSLAPPEALEALGKDVAARDAAPVWFRADLPEWPLWPVTRLRWSPLWRFEPEDVKLVAVQVLAAQIHDLPPPWPALPSELHAEPDALDELLTRWERHHIEPLTEGWLLRWLGRQRVCVYHLDAGDLDDAALEARHTALRGWLQKHEPWPLPPDWETAWKPILGALGQELMRRRAVASRERTARSRAKREGREPWQPDERPLVEIIGETVRLSQNGTRFVGLCPFHRDTRPSLTVSNEKGWFCGPCGVGGRAGTWIRMLRGGA